MSTAELERLGEVRDTLEDVHDALVGIQMLLSWLVVVGATYYLYKSGVLERLARV
jgi:hypothetical protein